MHRSSTAVAATFLLSWAGLAAAQGNELTLDQALSLARERAPAILAARERIAEARGRLQGASRLLHDNPTFEAAAGPRRTDRGDFSERELELRQNFELGGRRRARIDGAQAGVTREIAAGDESTRLVLGEVAAAFLAVLAAQERVSLTTAAHQVAEGIRQATERRYEAGEASLLDGNVARVAAARARSEILSAEADQASSLGELRNLLGMSAEEPLGVRGDLRDRRRYGLAELLSRAPDRPDLRMLGAEKLEAEAEVRLGQGLAWPDLGLRFAYEREEEADIVLGGVSFTLPVFDRGQGIRAEARARAARARLALDAGSRSVDVSLRAAYESYRRRVEAVEELEREALPGLDESESLSRLGYEAGEIGLLDLLFLRREILETRTTYLNRLLEAALSGVELEVRAGVLR